MSAPNKYTVHQRLTNAENRCAQLEAEAKALRVHLAGELKTAVENAKHSFRDGRDGAPGKDGESIIGPKGDKGEHGDVLYIGPDEVAAEVKKVRAELLRLRAAFVGRIVQSIADHQGELGVYTYLRKHMEGILRDIENL